MTLPEVLTTLSENPEMQHLWFRPTSYRSMCQAYRLSSGFTQKVPGHGGGECFMSHEAKVLAGEWEIISPLDVLQGK